MSLGSTTRSPWVCSARGAQDSDERRRDPAPAPGCRRATTPPRPARSGHHGQHRAARRLVDVRRQGGDADLADRAVTSPPRPPPRRPPGARAPARRPDPPRRRRYGRGLTVPPGARRGRPGPTPRRAYITSYSELGHRPPSVGGGRLRSDAASGVAGARRGPRPERPAAACTPVRPASTTPASASTAQLFAAYAASASCGAAPRPPRSTAERCRQRARAGRPRRHRPRHRRRSGWCRRPAGPPRGAAALAHGPQQHRHHRSGRPWLTGPAACSRARQTLVNISARIAPELPWADRMAAWTMASRLRSVRHRARPEQSRPGSAGRWIRCRRPRPGRRSWRSARPPSR